MYTELKKILDIEKHKPQMIIIEGLIGAGKSTLTDIIKKLYPEVVIFKEPVHDPIISRIMPIFYDYLAGKNTMRSSCFSFQFAWLTIRCQMHHEACRMVWQGKTVVFDRSVYGDSAFAHNLNQDGHITDTEFEIYMNMRNYLTAQLYVPHKFIWLDVPVKKVMERIKRRDRVCERAITEDYLWGLLHSYKKMVLKPFNKIGKVTNYAT